LYCYFIHISVDKREGPADLAIFLDKIVNCGIAAEVPARRCQFRPIEQSYSQICEEKELP